jgi:hypothetical protein
VYGEPEGGSQTTAVWIAAMTVVEVDVTTEVATVVVETPVGLATTRLQAPERTDAWYLAKPAGVV